VNIEATFSLGVIGVVTEKFNWYLARSTGIVSWALVAGSVIWGLVLSARVLNKSTAPGWLLDLHRYLGAASIVFTVLHMAALYFHKYIHFGFKELLVPYASKWAPGPVAWGIAAFYLMLAVEITSLVRSRISRKIWRLTHYLSFPLFVGCTIHGIKAGTDSGVKSFEWFFVFGTSAVIVLLILRIIATEGSKKRKTAGAPALNESAA
jgi:predicted ferric reductase